ncbi:hypothetical protein AMAG_08428 [Allomyces macrogynus ATCC 38327]|uniref:DUF4246 domain-containing protein n=1 Tax=Allomyces macrogynus (strain ATCC 38327) TaxID=578462 RepID=A0A0L0SL96_ALLM3|nr:hypothetical protein AMAG_08428 [Allomyces macrogynus ATCC 38327]|eukprot:KNE63287.1 hypothetical protein AMAG_08428 [Allomyces macrogynus ATCC 38327]
MSENPRSHAPADEYPPISPTAPLPLPFVDRTDDFEGDTSVYPARTRREQRMCALLNAVRDKPFWARKWRTAEIRAKLAAEIKEQAANAEWIVPVVASLNNEDDEDDADIGRILRGAMPDADLDYVLQELDWQAEHLPTIAGTDGVFALDDAVPDDLRALLVAQVFDLLENVPDHYKDWHPRSNNQVLDLVHPSLYPLVYGRTRVLDQPTTSVDDWCKYISGGTPTQPPTGAPDQSRFLSQQFQWLPSEFAVDKDGKVAITSYVNNLHPERHAALYPTLARVFECALPLLEQVLGRLVSWTPLRIDPTPWNWYDRYDPTATDQKYTSLNDWYQKRIPNLPDPPREYAVARNVFTPYPLRGRTLKVITKLASIHLTPADPTYSGGSWHIEGMLNESIVATALYYWDVDNITDSRLEFRTGVKPPEYEQSDDRGIAFGYALYRDKPLVQPWGHVTARQGRMVAFPNMFQHHVAPFELADKTCGGCRKIVAFFVVDPSSTEGGKVVSTAQVPPQQAEWIADAWAKEGRFPLAVDKELPRELIEKVVAEVDSAMSLDEAKKVRLALMDERSVAVETVEELVFKGAVYNLCEH